MTVIIAPMAMPAEPLSGPTPTDALGERLLAAAIEVFAERGYDRAGVAEIARRAGVTTGAIYSRYAGKAQLLAAALEAHATDDLDALFADHQFQGRAEDVLAIAGRHLVDAPDDGGRGTTLLAEAFVAARRDPAVAELLRGDVLERQQKLRTIIEAAKASGGISPALDTEVLVTFCHALGFGFVMLGAVDVPMPDVEPWEQLIAHLVAALADPPAPVFPTADPHP
jgi:TetR/AcrR family transcriptional repressor of uid operon